MRLRVEHELVQVQDLGLAEDGVEVLQRLRQPEALHLVVLARLLGRHVVDLCARDRGLGMLFDLRKHAPGGVLEGFVAGQAVQDEDRFDGFGAQDVARVGHGGEARGDAVFFEEVLGALGGVFDLGGGGVGGLFGEDGGVVGFGVPGAVGGGGGGGFARVHEEDFRHDACLRVVVGPDTAVDELARDAHVGGVGEGFGGEGNHAAGEAAEVLAFGLGRYAGFFVVSALGAGGARAAGDKDVGVVGGEGAEEDVFLDWGQGGFVHLAVLGREAAEEKMLLGEVFVDGVGHAAEGEGRVLEGESAGVACGGPETGEVGVGLGGL